MANSPNVEKMLDKLIQDEGGYSNNSKDSGGETMYGITVSVARANGYAGAMKDLPLSVAKDIYRKQYWTAPKFDKVHDIFPAVAEEMFDCGVNMGPKTASVFLQRCLNAFNREQKLYSDITVDGAIGNGTISALTKYRDTRKAGSGSTLLKAILCLRGQRYIELAEKKASQEEFVYGWITNRISFKE